MVQRIEHTFDENGVEMKFCGHKDHKAFVPVTAFGKGKTWDNLRATCKVCIKRDFAAVSDAKKEERKTYHKNYDKKRAAESTNEQARDNVSSNQEQIATQHTEHVVKKPCTSEPGKKTERKEHRTEDGVVYKHCSACEGSTKAAWHTLDHFVKEERRWDHLAAWCKECFNEKRNANRPSRAKPNVDKTNNPTPHHDD